MEFSLLKRFTIFLFFTSIEIILAGSVSGQHIYGPSLGIGSVVPEKGVQEYRLNFPYAEFELYTSPGGTKFGYIYKKNLVNLVFNVSSQSTFRVNERDLVQLVPSGFCLKYYEEDGDFIKVLKYSTPNGVWMSKSEMHYLRFEAKSWMAFFLEKKSGFFSIIDVGLNLRQKPDAKSNKVALLKSDYFIITLTGNTDDLWAEVNVKRYGSRPCSSKNPESLKEKENLNGWLKILDDAGYPNIWFHVKGCD